MTELKPRALDLERTNPDLRWIEGRDLFQIEPPLNREALGAAVTRQAQVLAYRYVLALATAAEKRGMRMRHGEVIGLERKADRIIGVGLRSGDAIFRGAVVLAMGPWSQENEAWVAIRVPVYPVRGQLLELRVTDPQLNASISYQECTWSTKLTGLPLQARQKSTIVVLL